MVDTATITPPPPAPVDLSAVARINEGMKAFATQVKASVDAIGDMIVGAFDRVMTHAVNEGGLLNMAKAAGSGLSLAANNVLEKAGSFNPFGGKESDVSAPAIAKTPEINAPEVGQKFPPEVAAAAMAAATPAVSQPVNVENSPTGNTGVSPVAVAANTYQDPLAVNTYQKAQRAVG